MAPLPLPTLLSQVLVAYTIELDNEAEQRVHHRTTAQRAGGGRQAVPWLISFALWANVLRYVDDTGVTVGALRERSRTDRLLLGGLRRWGYVTLTPPSGSELKNPPQDEAVVRATPAGRIARDVWRDLPDVVEANWRSRFGDAAVDRLGQAARSVFELLPIEPPAYLPVIAPTQNGTLPQPRPRATVPVPIPELELSRLLSGVLVAFTLDFESHSRISLPISANTLRVLAPSGVRVRDLPRLTGVSREANAMCCGWLERHGCAITGAGPSPGSARVARLTPKGEAAQLKYVGLLESTEQAWRVQYGVHRVDEIRAALSYFVADGTLPASPLARCLEPHPSNWRARVRRPDTLPHYPMVLHRGGYPDGS